MTASHGEIARLSGSAGGVSELSAALDTTWKSLLDRDDTAEHAARILGIPRDQLRQVRNAPMQFEPDASGLGGVELVLLVGAWVATNIVLETVKDMAKEELEKRLRKLWKELISPALRAKVGDEKLGSEIDNDRSG